jgi:hypothetical protein
MKTERFQSVLGKFVLMSITQNLVDPIDDKFKSGCAKDVFNFLNSTINSVVEVSLPILLIFL